MATNVAKWVSRMGLGQICRPVVWVTDDPWVTAKKKKFLQEFLFANGSVRISTPISPPPPKMHMHVKEAEEKDMRDKQHLNKGTKRKKISRITASAEGQPRQRRSPVWQHFTEFIDEEVVVCNYCQTQYVFKPSTGTT
jgi:hypothetical protein